MKRKGGEGGSADASARSGGRLSARAELHLGPICF